MLLNGLVLASLSVSGFYLVWVKLPRKIRRFLQKHSLLTDAIALLLTYTLFGGTLTALIAAAMVGIFTSILLHIANDPDSYTFIFDYCAIIKEKIAEVKVFLKEFNEGYVAKKENQEVANG